MKKGFLLTQPNKERQANGSFSLDKRRQPSNQSTCKNKNVKVAGPVSSSLLDLEDAYAKCASAGSMPQLQILETFKTLEEKKIQDEECGLLHSGDSVDQNECENDFGIREVSSTRNVSDMLTDNMSNVGIDSYASQYLTNDHTMVDSSVQNNEISSEINLLTLSRQLSVCLMRIQRKKNEALCQEFISAQLKNRLCWAHAWKLLLHRIATKNEPTATQMAVAMLQTNPGINTFYNSCRDSKRDRILLLGAALLVSHVSISHSDCLSQEEFHLKILSHFVSMVNDAKEKRTVLAHECMTASYRLISSHHVTCKDKSQMLRLLEVQEQWYEKAKRDHWRRSCAMAVILDWKSLIGIIADSTKCIEDDNFIDFIGLKNFGGICHTLVDSSRLEVGEIQTALKKALAFSPQQRTIMRGITANFHQNKKLWSNELLPSFVRLILPVFVSGAESETLEISLRLLVSLLQNATEEKIGDLIDIILMFLADHQENNDLPLLIGKPWRMSLIESDDVCPNRYAAVLKAICCAMFRAPDQTTPLVFYGVMVDVENPGSCRVAKGIKEIISLCVKQLEIIQTSDGDIYFRLAPLVLIRRVRTGVWQATWENLLPECTSLKDDLLVFGEFIRETMTGQSKVAILPSERKLAAEIAGMCLPFTKEDSFSSFTIICLPAFRTVATLLQGKVQSYKDAYRPAKAALYAACCQVSLAQENGETLKAITSFALYILQAHNEDNELVELQRGCIDFFAACLQVEVSTKKKSLVAIVTALREILKENFSSIKWLDTTLFGFSSTDKHLESTVLKTCILNSYLLVSKNISEKILRSSWAKSIGPWVLNLSFELSEKRGTAPLIAALQILFVLVTRTSSLTPVENQLRRTNRCILQSLQHSDAAVRLAALKLLLAVIYLNGDEYESLGHDAINVLSLVNKISEDDNKFGAIAKPILRLHV
mmetsp:Transcript_24194/g.35846  ORF Transcript_24194/g.35846 Transcript_24194/m.35846 type:complete len:939 (-) Transcript_24194:74-2890(-)